MVANLTTILKVLIPILGQDRNGVNLNALFNQRLRLVGRGYTVDAAFG